MDRATAVSLILSGNARERLDAAQFLSRYARAEDLDGLRRAYATEDIPWIKSRLEKAIQLASGSPASVATPDPPEGEFHDIDPEILEAIRAEAVEQIAASLVHELERILGLARLSARKEIIEFESSATRKELDRIEALLAALIDLAKSASPPNNEDTYLGPFLEDVAKPFRSQSEIPIELIGPEDMGIYSDPSRLHFVISNALANALEATEAAGYKTSPPVVLDWGRGDTDVWIAVMDRGIGLPPKSGQILEFGTSTKRGHTGAGLAVADQAARSLGGRILLAPRDGGGTLFEFRWTEPPE